MGCNKWFSFLFATPNARSTARKKFLSNSSSRSSDSFPFSICLFSSGTVEVDETNVLTWSEAAGVTWTFDVYGMCSVSIISPSSRITSSLSLDKLDEFPLDISTWLSLSAKWKRHILLLYDEEY